MHDQFQSMHPSMLIILPSCYTLSEAIVPHDITLLSVQIIYTILHIELDTSIFIT